MSTVTEYLQFLEEDEQDNSDFPEKILERSRQLKEHIRTRDVRKCSTCPDK